MKIDISTPWIERPGFLASPVFFLYGMFLMFSHYCFDPEGIVFLISATIYLFIELFYTLAIKRFAVIKRNNLQMNLKILGIYWIIGGIIFIFTVIGLKKYLVFSLQISDFICISVFYIALIVESILYSILKKKGVVF